MKRLTADEFVKELGMAPRWAIMFVADGYDLDLMVQYKEDETPTFYRGPQPLDMTIADYREFLRAVDQVTQAGVLVNPVKNK